MPSPHELFLEDYEYYDALGRDPLQQNNIWFISDPTEQVERLKEVLQEYPNQKQRRQMLFTAASRGDEAIVRSLVETGLRVHPNLHEGQDGEREGQDREREGQDREREGQDGEREGEKSEDGEDIPDKGRSIGRTNTRRGKERQAGCVDFLLKDIDVDFRDDLGRTPLIAAAMGGDTDTIKYLLGQGADPTARSDGKSELAKKYLEEFASADALETVAAERNVEA
ncbi:hypothetical protein MMC19_000905, partial [Ptychographa xylographoides]|nr:hypothetical protein [Ptychographa xylographoides]